MKTKSLIVFAVMTLALLLSACGPTTSKDVRTLSVSGTGQANLAPDIAYIYVGVHTENPTAAAAVTENTTQTQKVIQAIKDFGIDEKDIRTTNFSIYPQDKYDPQTGTPTGDKTYVVDNTVYVTVRSLTNWATCSIRLLARVRTLSTACSSMWRIKLTLSNRRVPRP